MYIVMIIFLKRDAYYRIISKPFFLMRCIVCSQENMLLQWGNASCGNPSHISKG